MYIGGTVFEDTFAAIYQTKLNIQIIAHSNWVKNGKMTEYEKRVLGKKNHTLMPKKDN